MTEQQPPNERPAEEIGQELLRDWQSRVARGIFLALGVSGTLLIVTYASLLTLELLAVGVFFVVGCAVLSAWKRLPPLLGGVAIGFVCNYAAVSALFAGDDPAPAAIYFLLGVIVVAILINWRAGMAFLLVNVGIFLLGSWANANSVELLPPIDPSSPNQRYFGHAFTLLLGGTVIVFSQGFLIGRLRRTLVERLEALEQARRGAAETERTLNRLKVTHEQMQKTQARLVAAGKLELLGQLAAGIAHDMNNALTVVMGETELLRDAEPQSAAAIVEAVGHVSHLTRQLLALGRQDLMRPEALALDRAIQQAETVLRRTLPSDIELVTSIEPDLIVYADGHQIQQVLLNLATNAAHAMPKGGTLTLTARRRGALAELCVSDTGTGIPPEVQERIFEPFFSTKVESVGTGLGLASVRAVVEGLDGTISVDSKPGNGTCFQVELPLYLGKTPPGPATESVRAPHGLLDAEFIVVEDDDQVRSVITSALLSSGARVLEAGDPTAGMEKARRSGRRFEVLCTDVVMPEGGGGKMIEWFQKAFPEAEIVICTGYSDDELLRRDIARGRYLLLRKPFSRAQLLKVCDQALQRARASRLARERVG